jgi:LPXTG-motif cell wall-anchored protein
MNPLRRAIGVVMFAVGFVWMLLGLGLVEGSVITGQTWAAILGFTVMAGGLFILTRKPKPTEPDSPAAPAGDGQSPAAAGVDDVDNVDNVEQP